MIIPSPSPRQAPSASAPPATPPPLPPALLPIGVGIDTSRYGHYAAFLRPDLLPATDELSFSESAPGYASLRARLGPAWPLPRFPTELVRDQVRQVRDVLARQKRLENLLVVAFRRLPTPNHLDTIPGLGNVTAAILTAFIGDINRFETPNQLVAYFGTLPIEASSGVERDGTPRGPKRYVMSKRGNDLVRRYLWMAALSAVRHNPAVRPRYLRVVAKHPEQKAIAIGHAMRKLLHLAFAIWKSGRPFDPKHYRWEEAAHVQRSDNRVSTDQRSVGCRVSRGGAARAFNPRDTPPGAAWPSCP